MNSERIIKNNSYLPKLSYHKLESVTKSSVMVALRYFTDTELLWHHANISLPWQQGPVGVQFE